MSADLDMKVVHHPVADLTLYEANAKAHPPEQVKAVAKSITEFGFTTPVLIDLDNVVIAGHCRIAAAKQLGIETVPTLRLDHLTPEQVRAYRLADNRLTEMGTWDADLLQAELQALSIGDFSLADLGFDSDAITALIPADSAGPELTGPGSYSVGSLMDAFIEPPLSLLRSSTGRWQHRKAAWLSALPLEYGTDLGRDEGLLMKNFSRRDAQFYNKKSAVEKRIGKTLTSSEFVNKYYTAPTGRVFSGTSQFDPVLAELMTIWFSPPGGLIYDPFAGDVERGLVAAVKGRRYHGIDVRAEQCVANDEAAQRLGATPTPKWSQGTSLDAARVWSGEKADLVFTCPPYWNLEKYSDDPKDLSNMPLEEFTATHNRIIAACAAHLEQDRFAVWVIGDVRDKQTGRFVRLHDRTKDGFAAAGMHLHSEIIFATPLGSKRIMARKAMNAKRTILSRHEYVLVFCKGDPAKAAKALGEVEVGEAPQEENDGK